ncbi:entericidin A/B family lipoprotein [Orrella dioscoreae]|nr:entericidin A/B family lipoprotein [Orrella dioscoreae]
MSAISAGCNTVDGAGKDIERGGEKIQGAADRNR